MTQPISLLERSGFSLAISSNDYWHGIFIAVVVVVCLIGKVCIKWKYAFKRRRNNYRFTFPAWKDTQLQNWWLDISVLIPNSIYGFHIHRHYKVLVVYQTKHSHSYLASDCHTFSGTFWYFLIVSQPSSLVIGSRLLWERKCFLNVMGISKPVSCLSAGMKNSPDFTDH